MHTIATSLQQTCQKAVARVAFQFKQACCWPVGFRHCFFEVSVDFNYIGAIKIARKVTDRL